MFHSYSPLLPPAQSGHGSYLAIVVESVIDGPLFWTTCVYVETPDVLLLLLSRTAWHASRRPTRFAKLALLCRHRNEYRCVCGAIPAVSSVLEFVAGLGHCSVDIVYCLFLVATDVGKQFRKRALDPGETFVQVGVLRLALFL